MNRTASHMLENLETQSVEYSNEFKTQKTASPLLVLKDVTKEFKVEAGRVTALRDVSLEIRRGEFISILGHSGSGKSTLLHLMGLLSKPTRGRLFFEDQEAFSLNERKLSKLRSEKVGFVFQSFHLLGSISALENVEVPLIYQRISPRERRHRAWVALEAVGMDHRAHHFPRQLSGGEAQRTAIARALVSHPSLILADEPTGNLDTRTGLDVLEILKKLNFSGVTIVIVTHDQNIARQAQRRVFLKNGTILNDDEIIYSSSR